MNRNNTIQAIAILIVILSTAFSCQKHVIAEPGINAVAVHAKEETLTINPGMTLAQINAVITGPISRIIDIASVRGNILSAPKLTRVGLSCNAKTNPIINAVILTRVNDL